MTDSSLMGLLKEEVEDSDAKSVGMFSIDDEEDEFDDVEEIPELQKVSTAGSTAVTMMDLHEEGDITTDEDDEGDDTVHAERARKKKERVVSSVPSYHPDYMFCGECTECTHPAPAPAPASNPLGEQDDRSTVDNNGSSSSSSSAAVVDWRLQPVVGSLHRSQIFIANLTLPSQVLVVSSLIKSFKGVSQLICTHRNRTAFVDHDPLVTSATDLCRALQDMGFPATVTKDGGHDLLDPKNALFKHGKCRSQLYVQGICCNSEVPAVKSILKQLKGVHTALVHVTTKMVTVEHDPFVISIQTCAHALTQEGFPSRIKHDGMSHMPSPPTSPTNANTSSPQNNNTNAKKKNTKGMTTLHFLKPARDRDIPKLRNIMTQVPGVKRIGVNLEENSLFVEHDIRLSSAPFIQVRLSQMGYAMTLMVDGADEYKERQRRANAENGGESSSLYEPIIPEPMTSNYVESTLLVPTLTTFADVDKMERIFHQNFIKSQVRAFYPHVPSRTIKVEHNARLVSAPTIVAILAHTPHYTDASVHIDGAVENLALPVGDNHSSNGDENDNMIQSGNGNEPVSKIHLNVLLSGLFWVVALLGAIPGWHNLEYAGLLSVLFGIPPVASKAWKTVRRRQFDANCMMVIAAFGALVLGEFDEAASVAFLFAISEWLEARATAKARRALGAIVSLRPDHANVLHPITKTITITAASRVPVGSLVSVRTGDKVPADGIVVEGTTTIDESSLTGEARPTTKRVDDAVAGGSINIGQTQLVVMTTSTVEDSAVSRLIRLVEEAQANRSPTEKLVDSFAKAYTPVVMIMATFMCTIPWLWGSETGRYWSLNGLIIIVLACPCALTVSSPITYSAGLAATAQRGIIIKGGVHLEALGHVKTIVFDKTGTLTQGKFALNHLDTIGTARTRTQLLELLSVMEAPSSHPLSATLVQAAKKEGIEPSTTDLSVTNHTVLKGEGVTARVNHEVIYVGNPRLFRRVGMYDDLPEQHKQAAEEWNQAGGTVGFLGIEGVGIIGAFCVSDVIREEARDVVHALQEGGMDVIMLTGDGEGAAKAVGLAVGLSADAIHSGLLPEDKLHFIGSLKGSTSSKSSLTSKTSVAQGMLGPCFSKKELVLMCGDGVNDAPALAVSDVGVAMGEGAALSMEMSDVTLMDSNLTKLLFSIKMGSKVILTIQENILFSLFAKIIVVGLTFWGKMTLLTAIASDVGVMLAVTLNGMKLLPGRQMASLQEEVYIKDEERQRRRAESKYHELPLAGSRQPNEMEEIL